MLKTIEYTGLPKTYPVVKNIRCVPGQFGSFFFGCISSAVSFALSSIIQNDGIHLNIR